MTKKTEKTKSVSEIQKEINKLHGEDAMHTMEEDFDPNFPRISSGVRELDRILGGGFAKGRIVDLYGPPSSGKTAICYYFLAEAQKEGTCVFFDLENSFDPVMAESSGINVQELLIVDRIEAAEDIFKLIDDLIMSGEVSAIVVDSFAGLVPRAEMNGDIGDSHVGLINRLASQFLRILTKKMSREKSETILVFVNQMRANIGAMGYGPTNTPTGGQAVKFYSSTRVSVAKIEQLKTGDDIVGQKVKLKTDKSKLSKPHQSATFDLYYDYGIMNEGSILDDAVKAGLVAKSGNWYTNIETGESLGNGKMNAMLKLRDEPEILQSLLNRLDT